MSVFVTHDLFRNTYQGMQCPATWPWSWSGSCLTAQAVCFPPHMMAEMDIRYAGWRLCWNPHINSGSAVTGVRLVATENGPSNLREVASFMKGQCTNPLNDAVDITGAIKTLLADAISRGVNLELIHQSIGNSTVGPIIYSSCIEMVYA